MFGRFCTVSIVMIGLIVGNACVLSAQDEPTKISSENLLPARTMGWFSVPNVSLLDQQFEKTQFGQLSKDEAFKPFIDSLKAQFKGWLDEKNVRLGIQLQDVHEIRTGEICLAGILPQQIDDEPKLGRGSHGLVVLVDVSDNEDQARQVLTKIEENMVKRGAVREPMDDILGSKISKWKIKPRSIHAPNDRFAFQTIAGGWLLASDNENIFREIIRRLADVENINAEETLASQPAFVAVAKETKVENVEGHVRWFVDPLGYFKLAQAIAEEEKEFRQRGDDWANILTKIGFNAIRGVGGSASFATYDHEILHRTYIFAPKTEESDNNQKRVFGLFDFENKKEHSLTPPNFVLGNVSAYFTATWNMSQAFANIGHVVDAFVKEPGMFDTLMKGFKKDLGIDLKAVVSSMDDQIYIVSETVTPEGDEQNERILIAVRLKDDGKIVLNAFEKNLIGPATPFDIEGIKVLEIVNETIDDEDLVDLGDDPFGDPFSESGDEFEEDIPDEFHLFEKKYIASKDGFLLVTNHKDLMRKVLASKKIDSLSDADDFRQVQKSLAELTDAKRLSFRQFGRIDQALKANYEMLRSGRMAKSNTILARVLNRMFLSDDPAKARQQKLDGSQLPTDFEKSVAPYLGPMGWVLETTDEGWLVTGVMLKKNEANQMVKRLEENEEPNERR